MFVEGLSKNERSVLSVLIDDPTASNHAIGKRAGLHHATVERIRSALTERLGVRHVVLPDPSQTGSRAVFYAYYTLSPQARSGRGKEARALAELPGVVGYGSVTHSRWDGWVAFVCDPEQYDRFMHDFKRRMSQFASDVDIIRHSLSLGPTMQVFEGLSERLKSELSAKR